MPSGFYKQSFVGACLQFQHLWAWVGLSVSGHSGIHEGKGRRSGGEGKEEEGRRGEEILKEEMRAMSGICLLLRENSDKYCRRIVCFMYMHVLPASTSVQQTHTWYLRSLEWLWATRWVLRIEYRFSAKLAGVLSDKSSLSHNMTILSLVGGGGLDIDSRRDDSINLISVTKWFLRVVVG